MQTHAVLFDLDCTLTDRPASIREFSRRFVGAFAAECRTQNPFQVNDVIVAAEQRGYAPRLAVCEAIAQKLDWAKCPSPQRLVEYWRADFPECTVARQGVRETLAALRGRGFKLAVVSNGNTRTQRRKIEVLGIADLLDALLISDEVGCRKPDCAIFNLALEKLGVEAANARFVGDHPHNDVEGARKAGMRAVWFRGVHPWPDDLAAPKHSIDRLEELLSIAAFSV